MYKPKRQLVLIPLLLREKIFSKINGVVSCNGRILSIPTGGVHSICLSRHFLITGGFGCAYTMTNKKLISNSEGLPDISIFFIMCEK